MITNTQIDEKLYLTDSGTPVCEGHIQPYIDNVSEASRRDYYAWFQCHGSEMSCQRCSGGLYDAQRDRVDADLLRESSSERRAGDISARDDRRETQGISPSFIRYAAHRHSPDLT
jgi:hypothetical protein